MGSSGKLRLKRLGSLKVYVVTEDRTDETGETVKAGSIAIFRRNSGRPSIYQTIYDALRSRTEIIARYGLQAGRGMQGEMKELAEVREHLQQTWEDLETAEGPSEPAEGSRVETRLAEVASVLKRKSNPLKSEARKKAVAGPVRSPKRRLVNRLATQSRVSAIDSRLAERQNQVCSILPWMRAMETALLLEIERSLGIIERLTREVGAMVAGHQFFRIGRTTPQQLKGIAARLKLMRRELNTLAAEPFLGFRRKAVGRLDQAMAEVGRADVSRARLCLDRIVLDGERILMQPGVESLLAQVSLAAITGPTAAELKELRRRTDSLVRLCSEPEMTESYFAVAVQLRQEDDALEASQNMLAAGLPEQARVHLDKFKQSLKSISRRLAR